jgi:hypothetical protein
LQNREPIDAGHHYIEQNNIIGLLRQALDSGTSILCRLQRVAGLREKLLHHAAEFSVIVDEQAPHLCLLCEHHNAVGAAAPNGALKKS